MSKSTRNQSELAMEKLQEEADKLLMVNAKFG